MTEDAESVMAEMGVLAEPTGWRARSLETEREPVMDLVTVANEYVLSWCGNRT